MIGALAARNNLRVKMPGSQLKEKMLPLSPSPATLLSS